MAQSRVNNCPGWATACDLPRQKPTRPSSNNRQEIAAEEHLLRAFSIEKICFQ